MAPKLLPSAEIKVSKKTISADSITSLSKNSSSAEKLNSIRKFLTLDFKRDRSSFIRKRREREAEKRRLREEKIEKEKESKFSLPSLTIANPLQNIFSSIGNFLLFLGGGMLFNKFFDLEESLLAVEKLLEGIGKGIQMFANVIGGVTNFIDSAYKGYDKLKKQISDITGLKEEDIEKLAGTLRNIINGTVIASLIVLRSLPRLLKNYFKNRAKNIKPNKPTKTPKVPTGHDTNLKPLSNKRPLVTRLARKGITRVLGKGGTRTLLRFSKRFISPILKKIPLIGGLVDFLLNYFVFGESLGRSAFKAIGATLFGALGAAIGGPFAVFTGIGGAMIGDWVGGKLADVILGDKEVNQIGGIGESAEYDQLLEITNNIIQPIET